MIEAGLERKDDFDKQMETFSTVKMGGKDASSETMTMVKVTKINPPENRITNPRGLVCALAWEHPPIVYKHMLRRLYELGRPTTTFDIPRAGSRFTELPLDERESVKPFAENAPEEVRAARILLGVLESENQVQADVLTHSRGFGYTAIAALIDSVRAKKEGRENRIRNIVAYAPNGLIGDDTMWQLIQRNRNEDSEQINFGPDWGGPSITMEQLAAEVSQERKEKIQAGELPPETETETGKILEELRVKKATAKARGMIEYGPADTEGVDTAKEVAALLAEEGMRHAFGKSDVGAENKSWVQRWTDSIPRAFREIRGLSKMQLSGAIVALRGLGIGVGIARGTDDTVFQTHLINHYMKHLRSLGVIDVSMTGVHDTLNRDPRAVQILAGIFQELEKQRKTTTTNDTSV